MRLRMGKYEVIMQPGECGTVVLGMEEVLTVVLIHSLSPFLRSSPSTRIFLDVDSLLCPG